MANNGNATVKLVCIIDPVKHIFQGENYILLAATVRQDVRAAKVEGGGDMRTGLVSQTSRLGLEASSLGSLLEIGALGGRWFEGLGMFI